MHRGLLLTEREVDRKVCSVLTFSDEAWTPYRELMALVGSSEGVASAMMAMAALHAMHGSIGSPIMLAHAARAKNVRIDDKELSPFQSQLLHHCISHKQRALEFLSTALQDPDQRNKLQTFGIAVVLALLECFETGAGSWAIHLEGAKKLLEAGIQKSSTLEGFVDELML
ncbi:c6 finger domain protein acr-2 [Fusarium flagelliforme]|uniref:C6 finger domain protein acr-2 n=1 Tax=Fusarium flagelliforme TaxID=2675880 RepID=A0A395MA60_9HYPO|nr:c6 finger domain protein acr-2 [Fusarium flagelliforme]